MRFFSKKALSLIVAVLTVAVFSAVPSVYADYYGNIQNFTGATINGTTNMPTGWDSLNSTNRSGEITSGLCGLSAGGSLFKMTSTETSTHWGNPPVYYNRWRANRKSDGTVNDSETLIDGSYYHLTAMVAACDMDFYNLGLYVHRVKVSGTEGNSGDLTTFNGPVLGFTQSSVGTVNLTAWGEDITPVGFEFETNTWYTLDVIFNGISNTMDTYLNGEFVKTVSLTTAHIPGASAYTNWHLYLLKYIGVVYDRRFGTSSGSVALFDNVGFGNYYYKSITKPAISTPVSNISVSGAALSGDTLIVNEGLTVSDITVTGNNVVFIDSTGAIKSGSSTLSATDRMVEQIPITCTATDTSKTYTDNETVLKYYSINLFDTNAANQKVLELNGKTAKAEFKSELISSQGILGIEIENAYEEQVADLLFVNKPYSNYSAFMSAFNISLLYIKISTGGTDTAKNILENNYTALGIDYDNTYNTLSAEGKTIMVSNLIGVDYSTKSFEDTYNNAYLWALFKTADDWGALKSILENNETEYGIQISKANALSNPASVYKRLFSQKGTASVLADVITLYDAAVTAETLAELNKSNRVFEINGNAYGTQMVLVLKDGQNLSDISNENPPAYIRPFSANGKFTEAVQISESSGNGYYSVYLDKNTEKGEVFVPDITSANSYIETYVNNSSNASTLKNYLLNAENVLGVRTSTFSQYADSLSGLLFAEIPFTNYKDFRDKYNKLEIIAKVNTIGTENNIINNENILGIDIANTYDKLTSNGKAILLSKLKQENYVGKNFADIYKKDFLFAAFKGADYYATIKSFLTQYASDYGINLADANVCKNVSGVYQVLMTTKESATKIEDIPTLFANAIRSELAEEEKSVTINGISGGGGSGGGTGGLGIGSVTIPSTNTGSSGGIATPFADMTNYGWASEAVKYLNDRNIINGVEPTRYEPSRNVTRAEFCKLIATLLNLDGENMSFNDISEDAWYSKYISACADNGIISGDGSNFYPEKSIKREDAATIIYRALAGKDFGNFAAKNFTDNSEISDYAAEGVRMLSSIGIISGNDKNEFAPMKSLTRAEAAVLIYKVAKMIE